jgi:hypothetical protein
MTPEPSIRSAPGPLIQKKIISIDSRPASTAAGTAGGRTTFLSQSLSRQANATEKAKRKGLPRRHMTGHSLGFLAAASAFALFGGLHLEIASGRGLDRLTPDDARVQTRTTTAAAGVNRAAKSDRNELSPSAREGRTITFQHPDLPSTTVALRLGETVGTAKGRPAPKVKQAPAKRPKQAVACEGAVSALTDVAKHLEAARCVT